MRPPPLFRSVRLRIHGTVQGVWYRSWMVEQASKLGVFGWVRNRRDGTVEAVVHGSMAGVHAMIELAREGPRLAEVTHVDVSEIELDDDDLPESFEQRPTA